ncbi:hypothetical protein BURPS305_0029 [Burkholderia pseudomallei 305]|nr:hypothetical protein BURPS305_0029 [Burkholderia pseudomallei 305]
MTQMLEQPGEKFAPVDLSTRESDVPLQVSTPITTIRLGLRSGRQHCYYYASMQQQRMPN